MIEIYLLEQLDAFARCGTLSRAAEELHITQPAISRSMKKLEAELGVALFNRDKAKIALNETGKLAADLARRVLDEDRNLVARVKAHDRALRNISFGSCAPWPVLATAQLLRVQFPNMTISTEVVAHDSDLISAFGSAPTN